MSSEEKKLDIKQIKNLVSLMVENDLSRIEIEEGDTRILIRRGQAPVYAPPPPGPPPPPPPAPVAAAPAPAAGGEQPPAEPVAESNEVFIRSPMVGTFYAAPDPESPPFVKVGDTVQPDTVVCLVEAMKVFNEIKAEVSGRVTPVLVSNAQAVEDDQPLFAVAPV